jgi:hypothetical protein
LVLGKYLTNFSRLIAIFMKNIEMKGVIFRNDWHLLSGPQIEGLFAEHFTGVTIEPNKDIVTRLKELEIATFEILENRSSSTVYRIRQTDEVFHLDQLSGVTYKLNTEEYFSQQPLDELLTNYVRKEPVFKGDYAGDGKYIIEHLKEPRFRALFINGSCDRVDWIDQPDIDASKLEKLMKKMGAFFASYSKK